MRRSQSAWVQWRCTSSAVRFTQKASSELVLLFAQPGVSSRPMYVAKSSREKLWFTCSVSQAKSRA